MEELTRKWSEDALRTEKLNADGTEEWLEKTAGEPLEDSDLEEVSGGKTRAPSWFKAFLP